MFFTAVPASPDAAPGVRRSGPSGLPAWPLDLPGVTPGSDGGYVLPNFPDADTASRFVRLLTDPYVGRDPTPTTGSYWFDTDAASVPPWFGLVDPAGLGFPFERETLPLLGWDPDGDNEWARDWGSAGDLIELACQALGGLLAGTVVGEWKASGRYPPTWSTYSGFRSLTERVFDRLHINHVMVRTRTIRHAYWFDRDRGAHAPSSLPVVRASDTNPFLRLSQETGKPLDDVPGEADSFAGAYLGPLLEAARGWMGATDCFAFPLQWDVAHEWGLWDPDDGGSVDATVGHDGAEDLMLEGKGVEDTLELLEDSRNWIPEALGPLFGTPWWLFSALDEDFAWAETLLPLLNALICTEAEASGDGPLCWQDAWPGRHIKNADNARNALVEIFDGFPAHFYRAAWGSSGSPGMIIGWSSLSGWTWSGAWDPALSTWDVPELSESLRHLLDGIETIDSRTDEDSRFEEHGSGLRVLFDFFGIDGEAFSPVLDGLDRDTNAQPHLWIGPDSLGLAKQFGAFEPGTDTLASLGYSDVIGPQRLAAEAWVEWWNAAGPTLDVARLIEVSCRILRQLFVVDHIFDPVLRQAMMGDTTGEHLDCGTGTAAESSRVRTWKSRFNEFSLSVRCLLEAVMGSAAFAIPPLSPRPIDSIEPGDAVFPSPGEILALVVRQVLTDTWIEFAVRQGANRDVMFALFPWMSSESSRDKMDRALGPLVEADLPPRLALAGALYLGAWDGRFLVRRCLLREGASEPLASLLGFISEGATGDPLEVGLDWVQVIDWVVDARSANLDGLFESFEPDFGRLEPFLYEEVPDDLGPTDVDWGPGDDEEAHP